MNRNRLIVLAILALLVVAAAAMLSGQQAPAEIARSGGPLVEGLSETVNDITQISVDDGDQQVTLTRADGVWGVAQRDGYRADISQIRKRLLALVESRRVEGKTTNPSRYVQLGVSDLAPEDGDEDNLKVAIAGPKAFDLLVGKRSADSAGTYVRFADQAQSWLASGDLRFSTKANDWLKKDVLDLPANRLRRVTLVHGDGDRVELEKTDPDEPNFSLVNVPEGREMLSPSAGNSIASALAGMRFEEVAPASSETFQQLEIVQGTFETFDGLRIGTRTFSRDDKFFLMLDVAFDQALADQTLAEAEQAAAQTELKADTDTDTDAEAAAAADDAGNFDSPEMAKAAADVAEKVALAASFEAAREEAEALVPLIDGWVFEIPSYKHGNLSKGLEDLLKPLSDGDDDSADPQ